MSTTVEICRGMAVATYVEPQPVGAWLAALAPVSGCRVPPPHRCETYSHTACRGEPPTSSGSKTYDFIHLVNSVCAHSSMVTKFTTILSFFGSSDAKSYYDLGFAPTKDLSIARVSY